MTQLTLVIDLNVCVGCHACEEPPCVSVCPTGASYKREDNGVVLVDYDKCIGLLATIATFALFICTAMIYASVKFLQEWYSPMTVANFTFPGVASGFMLAAAYSAYLGNQTGRFLWHPRRHRDPDGAWPHAVGPWPATTGSSTRAMCRPPSAFAIRHWPRRPRVQPAALSIHGSSSTARQRPQNLYY